MISVAAVATMSLQFLYILLENAVAILVLQISAYAIYVPKIAIKPQVCPYLFIFYAMLPTVAYLALYLSVLLCFQSSETNLYVSKSSFFILAKIDNDGHAPVKTWKRQHTPNIKMNIIEAS